MALKPPPVSDVFRQINGLLGDSGLKGEVDRNMRSLIQSALARLDVVSREEFDSQTEILARTRSRVEELEQELAELTELLQQASDKQGSA
ncbi:MAG: accessory factor UbiK family protein [Halieaceae bacterium]